ncbi:MAG: GH92 family glycosyl hydrolase [Bacteroidetes bacterium]|nr:GH92 family glycosyl hydrolase [Bacteroidota bacterium]MBU1116941.1 GH92 family glycosyl hydrolase [Bacteroidota bacterium]MBU1799114.1 GH92 family glycosyl hydrolase [Bacteroidota bacterium]
MSKGLKIFAIFLFASIIYGQSISEKDSSLVNYVNPLIGTAPSRTISSIKHGEGTENNAQVIPSVTMPFGMTNWTAQTRNVETKCVAPYYYADSLITGFRGSHWLSGSCTQDYGSFTVMPISGNLNYLPEKRGSHYSHQNEVSTPYYYKVGLKNYNVDCEITATTRAGFMRFTFNDSENKYIIIEPNSDENEGYIKILPETQEIVGYNPVHRIYQGWGDRAGFSGYFVAKFDQPFEVYGVYENYQLFDKATEISNREKIGAYIGFLSNSSKVIKIKIGTSFVSLENARENLNKEIGNKNFDEIKNELKEIWNKQLLKVKIKSSSNNDKVKFYTSIYHSFQHPRIYSDLNGEYPSFNGGTEIKKASPNNYYSDFSVWDTYRALHPLFNIIMPDKSNEMIKSLLSMAEQGGWLPIFPCWNSYTSAMIGDHVISIIADGYVKGVVDLTEKEYFYLKQNATKSPENLSDYIDGKGRRALQSYLNYGYIPLEDSVKESFHQQEQVSRTLEYAYDDFTLSQISKKMGYAEDYENFFNRSKNYRNVFDSSVKSVRGKFKNGAFTDEFLKDKRMPYITEGTPWQYTWYVPQDVNGLINLMGGIDEFNKELDKFFETNNYWHGNEPGHQIPFLYTYSGQPSKTNKIVSKILAEEYSAEPGGLSGNDDSGQMSAWYIFATLGFYPVCPGSTEYAVFLPAFEESTLNVGDGKTFIIKANGLQSKNKVKTILLNNKVLEKNIINHSDITNGGTLEFVLE